MKLYELSHQMVGLKSLIEEGEMDSDALADTLDALEGDIQVKAESLLGYVANLASDVDAINIEINRLQARKKTIANRQNGLREYLRTNMIAAEIKKITCPLFSITLRKAAQAVSVDDMALLLPKYQKRTVTADMALIKADLKAGKDVPGCRLIDGKQGLLIK